MPGDHRVGAARAGRPHRIIAAVQRVYRNSTRVLGLLVCLLGVAILVSTLARGGGPLALGVFVGLGFVVFGAGRVYLAGDR